MQFWMLLSLDIAVIVNGRGVVGKVTDVAAKEKNVDAGEGD